MSPAKLLLLQLCTSTALLAQTSSIIVSATLPKGVDREDARLGLFIDGQSSEIPCSMSGYSSDGSTIFMCEAKRGKHSALFRFKMPGYKPYSINVADLTIGDNPPELKLGVLHPADSEEPRIENIVLTRSTDQSMRFQISVNNLSKKQILITGITMQAEDERACGVGLHPPLYFKISDRLTLTPSSSGKSAVSGTIADAGDHPEFPAEVAGVGVFHPCGHSEFSLSAPMNFTIPAQDYFAIELLIPSSHKSSAADTRSTTAQSRTTIATSEVVGRFGRIRFTLKTSDRDYRTITSYYSRYDF